MVNQDKNYWGGKDFLRVFQWVEAKEKAAAKKHEWQGEESEFGGKYRAESDEPVFAVNEGSDIKIDIKIKCLK